MKVFNYSKDTFELVDENEAVVNPLEKGKYLIPAFSTTIKPKSTKAGFTQCFDETLQKWEYVEDNREKTVYSKTTKEKIEIDYIGKIKEEDTLLEPKQFDKWNKDTQSWIEDIELKKEFEKSLVPISITQRQCRLMLVQIDKYQEAIAFIENSSDDIIKIEWEYASTIERTNPLVSALAEQLKLTKEQLDKLFMEASQI